VKAIREEKQIRYKGNPIKLSRFDNGTLKSKKGME
jgi:hypothetical protein